MSLYRITWEIDIDAESPQEAAERALEIHRDPKSIATVFIVRNEGAFRARGRDPVTVDLSK
jgi:hypothetical protein